MWLSHPAGPDGARSVLDPAHAPHLERAVMAHRGLSAHAPENTLPAFEMAAQAGARWIETDTDLSADGVPVIVHDTDLDRTTSLSGPLYDYTAAQLAQADAGAWKGSQWEGVRLPLLSQVIDLVNEHQLNLNCEIKGNEQGAQRLHTLVDAVAAELERLDPGRQVIVSSFSVPTLMAFHQAHPQWAIGLLLERCAYAPDWRTTAEMCGAVAIHPEDAGLTREYLRPVVDAGYLVNVWTVNRPDRAHQLFSWGATGIFTDDAAALGHLSRTPHA